MDRISLQTLTLGTLLKCVGIVVLAGLLVWYVHFQARNFLEGPTIDISDTHGVLHHERTIPLSGVAHNIVKLTLNGKEIHTSEAGVFNHTLVLEDGYTIMTLSAHDRFGRTTSLTREFVYAPL
jgi:hypothetical protein